MGDDSRLVAGTAGSLNADISHFSAHECTKLKIMLLFI